MAASQGQLGGGTKIVLGARCGTPGYLILQLRNEYTLKLQSVFRPEALRKVFMERAWGALRGQPYKDLLFFYDYRRNIEERSVSLAEIVSSGAYRPRATALLRMGRPDLLTRYLHLLHPDDALVMQALFESFYAACEKVQPSARAFFTRSHEAHPGIHNLDQKGFYPWFKLWPKYQSEILRFARQRKYLVATDVQNFFDSASHAIITRALKRYFADWQEPIDFLLFMFDGYMRREPYASATAHGIPTIDVDAPRFVGHVLLFHIDEYLDKTCSGSYARWLDDINFGVDDTDQARQLLGSVEERLRRVGLRLGGGKTSVLTYREARDYLQADENQRITLLRKDFRQAKRAPGSCLRLAAQGALRYHLSRKAPSWERVMRRHYLLCADINEKCARRTTGQLGLLRRLEALSRKDFHGHVSCEYRSAILRLHSTLAPTPRRLAFLLDELRKTSEYDDVTSFRIAEMLCAWRITDTMAERIRTELLGCDYTIRTIGGFGAAAWLMTKYGDDPSRVTFVERSRHLWAGNELWTRQAITVWSVLRRDPTNLGSMLRLHGGYAAARMFDFIDYLRSQTVPDNSLRSMTPLNRNLKNADLPRAVLSANVLRSELLETHLRSALQLAWQKITDDRHLLRIVGV